MVDGEALPGGSNFDFDHKAQFVYLGEIKDRSYDNFEGVLDQSLPDWITKRLDTDFGRIIDSYKEDFGRTDFQNPYIFAFADELSRPGLAFSGVAYKGQTLVLSMRGEGILKKSKLSEQKLMFLIAHEIGHMFQIQDNAENLGHGSSWVVEGAANWMTHQTLAKLGVFDQAKLESDIRESYNDCVSSFDGLFQVGVPTSARRYYDCGEVMIMIADAFLPDHTVYEIWNIAADKSRRKDFTPKRYFAALKDLGVSSEIVGRMEILANEKIERASALGRDRDYEGMLRQLLIDAGLKPVFASDGTLTEIDLP